MDQEKKANSGNHAWMMISFAITFAAGVSAESIGFLDFAKENYLEIWILLLEHIQLVAISSSIAIIIGVPIGIFLTRGFMKSYKDLTLNVLGICQTVPSLAVIAIGMTYIGIGKKTAIFALVIYSLLPIIRNTVVGIGNIDPVIIDAGRGMGMTPFELLFKVELPNSMYIILTGIRTSTVINVGTAAMAFLVSGGGLGDLIFTGIALVDPAYMLAGAVPTALLAITLNWCFGLFEKIVISPGLKHLE